MEGKRVDGGGRKGGRKGKLEGLEKKNNIGFNERGKDRPNKEKGKGKRDKRREGAVIHVQISQFLQIPNTTFMCNQHN